MINLTLELTVNKSELQQGRVEVEAVLRNAGEVGITFLPWNTPFEKSVNGNFYAVALIDGEQIKVQDYVGRMVKRRAPETSDYLKISPGESIVNQQDITKSYNFCAGEHYKIAFSGDLYDSVYSEIPILTEPIEFATGISFPSCQ